MKLHYIYLAIATAVTLTYTPTSYSQNKTNNKGSVTKSVDKKSNNISLNLKYKCKDNEDNINYRAEKENGEECWLMTMSEIKKLEIASTPVNPKEQFSAPKYVWVKDRFYVGDEVVTKDQTPPEASAFTTTLRTGIRISLNPEDSKKATKITLSNKNESNSSKKENTKPDIKKTLKNNDVSNNKTNLNKSNIKNENSIASLSQDNKSSAKTEAKKEIKLSSTIEEQLNVMRKSSESNNKDVGPRILVRVPDVKTKPILEEAKSQISSESQRVAITPEDFLLNK